MTDMSLSSVATGMTQTGSGASIVYEPYELMYCLLCCSMFGDPRELDLHYFLADDTIEILEKIPPNSGRDAVSTFLRRAKLPKVRKIDETLCILEQN